MAGLAITAAAIVWHSLLVRKALLLVAVVFAPLAFSGASWDASRGWIGKWAMFVVALICSKLVLVVMFLVAITQVSAPIDADLASVSDPSPEQAARRRRPEEGAGRNQQRRERGRRLWWRK